MSSKLSNEFYFSGLDSSLKADIYFYRYKYATLQNDRDRPGVFVSFDFPITKNVRATPNLTWHQDGFAVQRPRLDNFRKGASEINIPATLVTPKNNYLSFGLNGYWDITRRTRMNFMFIQESTTSNIPEFNATQTQWLIGYSWSFPSAKTVLKRTQRFADDGFSEEF